MKRDFDKVQGVPYNKEHENREFISEGENIFQDLAVVPIRRQIGGGHIRRSRFGMPAFCAVKSV